MVSKALEVTGAAAVLAALLPVPPAAAQEVATLALVDRSLVAVRDDGSILADAALAGVTAPFGRGRELRIDGFVPAGADARVPRPLYDISIRRTDGGDWQKLCEPDPEGRTTAIPVPGYWNPDGTFELISAAAFSLSCTASAEAECVRLGYAPWQYAPDGTSLQAYHRACVHMIRADYCGDRSGDAVAGTRVEVFDRAGINRLGDPPIGEPEALWGPEGAVCLARPRRSASSLPEIRDACPRLAEAPADGCTADGFESLPEALVGNRS